MSKAMKTPPRDAGEADWFDTERIRAANPLPVYIAAQGINLARCGRQWRALCPLHEEKTPSFTVWEDRFHCYGCSAHGDVIDLDQRLHRRSFAESCRALGGQEGPRFARRRARRRPHRNDGARCLAEAAGKQLQSILEAHRSDDWRSELLNSSPVAALPGEADRHWALMIGSLFPPHSILFVGDLYDSGPGRGEGHFREAGEWLECPRLPGPRMAAATFRPGTVSRAKSEVLTRPYLVLESDEIIGRKPTNEAEREANKAASHALFRWCEQSLGLHLAAVVDTGNRSLHGWFSMPRREGIVEQLAVIAPALRLDGNLFRQPHAPLRLPGAVHEKTGLPAQLLYLANMT